MMSYLRWADAEPAVLRKELCFKERLAHSNPKIPPARSLQLGRCYPVSELIERMIVYSDNDAKDLLTVALPD